MNEYPHIKWIGGCFGEQAIAHSMDGLVEKRPRDPKQLYVLGREFITPTDEFFEQGYIKIYMDKNDLTKETFPKLVL